MAPRRQRSKVGMTRMHAALDAMRPMGFPADAVRKCVKQLLKVYGNDGWAFLEESAYKLLIETILDEPEDTTQEELEEPQPEPHLPGESSHDNHQQAEPVHHLCGKQVMDQEQAATLEICQPKVINNDFKIGKVVKQEQDMLLDVSVPEMKAELESDGDELSPMPLQVEGKFSLPPPDSTSQLMVCTPVNKTRRPCYGWISDGEDEDEDYKILQLIPSGRFDD